MAGHHGSTGGGGSVAALGVTPVLAVATLSGDTRHASDLMPVMEELLRHEGWAADSITEVFVSIGPGSFTGLRVGVTIARTLGWSVGARIVAVPTLDGLARNALSAEPPPPHLAVILDAKRSEVFASAFDLRDGRYARVIDARLADPREFLSMCPRPIAVLGEGLSHHRRAVEECGAVILDPELWAARAEHVVHLGLELSAAGRYTEPGELVPLYIRRPDAEERWEARHGKSA